MEMMFTYFYVCIRHFLCKSIVRLNCKLNKEMVHIRHFIQQTPSLDGLTTHFYDIINYI